MPFLQGRRRISRAHSSAGRHRPGALHRDQVMRGSAPPPASDSRSSQRGMPRGCSAPRSTMSLKAACVAAVDAAQVGHGRARRSCAWQLPQLVPKSLRARGNVCRRAGLRRRFGQRARRRQIRRHRRLAAIEPEREDAIGIALARPPRCPATRCSSHRHRCRRGWRCTARHRRCRCSAPRSCGVPTSISFSSVPSASLYTRSLPSRPPCTTRPPPVESTPP